MLVADCAMEALATQLAQCSRPDRKLTHCWSYTFPTWCLMKAAVVIRGGHSTNYPVAPVVQLAMNVPRSPSFPGWDFPEAEEKIASRSSSHTSRRWHAGHPLRRLSAMGRGVEHSSPLYCLQTVALKHKENQFICLSHSSGGNVKLPK